MIMQKMADKLAIRLFDVLAAAKGYRFELVDTVAASKDIAVIYDEEGFSFPEELEEDVRKYKAGTLNFIAYYKNIPVGTVRLADPRVVNRAWDHYGVDKEGQHHEIQSLVVRNGYRDGAQFVMLGLVKKLYVYSLANGIKSW